MDTKSNDGAVTGKAEILQGNVEEIQKYVVCDVCGYANLPTDALCKKCSNYLFDGRGTNGLQK